MSNPCKAFILVIVSVIFILSGALLMCFDAIAFLFPFALALIILGSLGGTAATATFICKAIGLK